MSLGFKNVRVDVPLPISVPTRRQPIKAPSAVTLGVIIGNRDFFPDLLVAEAREDIVKLFAECGIAAVMVSPEETKLGGVETHADARKCAELFSSIATRSTACSSCCRTSATKRAWPTRSSWPASTCRCSCKRYPDDLNQLGVARRRDAFCGKISVCNNLVQAGIKFTLTEKHVVGIRPSDSFQADLDQFVARLPRGEGRARRAARRGRRRPGAFNTVRYSEKILERNGISVTTVDLSEFLGQAGKLERRRRARAGEARRDPRLRAGAGRAGREADADGAGSASCSTRWIDANALDATAIQCWTSVQQNFGCNVCTLMSMMSERSCPAPARSTSPAC